MMPEWWFYMRTDKVLEIGNVVKTGSWDSPQRGRVYLTYGVSPCLNTGGAELQGRIIEVYEE